MPRFPFQNHVTPPGTGRVLLFLLALASLCCLAVVLHPTTSFGQTSQFPDFTAAAIETVIIWDDSGLRLTCIAGSIGGAVLSVFLFPPTSSRAMAGKMCGSVIAGTIFTPAIMRWMGAAPDADSLLFCAGTVALTSWTVLLTLMPMLPTVAKQWLNGKAPTATDNQNPPTP